MRYFFQISFEKKMNQLHTTASSDVAREYVAKRNIPQLFEVTVE